MPEETNGNSASRLDRIERMVEALAYTQTNLQAHHQEMQSDIRILLSSQVLITETIQKLTTSQILMTEKIQELTADVQELREQAKQTDANLGALLLTVDEMIRGNKPGAQGEE